MTQNKKKRGRPPGSGKKKPEMGLQNTDMILPGNLGNIAVGNGDVREIEKVFKGNDGVVTMTIGAKKPVIDAYEKLPDTTIDEPPMYEKVFPKSDAEIKREAFEKELREKGVTTTPNKGILAVNADKFMPLPDNWFSLSKVQKLEWLTANPRK